MRAYLAVLATAVRDAAAKRAAFWTQIGVMDLNWDRYLKYRILPDFFSTDLHVLVNLKKWQALSPKTREILQQVAIKHETDSLQALHRRDPDAGPHPRTAEWEASYSRAIPGATCASQLETVQRWYDTGQRDHQQVRAVSYGTRPAPAIEQAVGARADDQDWEQRLADALTAFRDCRWPLDYLRPAAGT